MADDPARQLLKDLYRDAVGAGVPRELAKWVFLEAKAIARREIADRRLKRLDSEDFSVRCKAWGTDMETARVLVMQHAPDDVRWHKAETALADAIEEVAVCGRMIEALSKQPPSPNQRPAPAPVPARTQAKG